MARNNPAPQKTAAPKSTTTVVFIDDFDLPINAQSVFVNTGFKNVVVNLPQVSRVPKNTIYYVRWWGPNSLTLQPYVDDDLVPPAGGPGVPLNLDTYGTNFVILFVDVDFQQWNVMAAADLSSIAGLFQALDARMRGFHFGAWAAQVGQVRTCEIQGNSGLGKASTTPLVLRLQLWDDQAYTVPAAAAIGTLTGGGKGVVLSGSGTNDLEIQLDAVDGLFSLSVDDGGVAGTIYATLVAVIPNVNNAGFFLQALEVTSEAWA